MLQAQNVKLTPETDSLIVEWDIQDDTDKTINYHYSHALRPESGANEIDPIIKACIDNCQRIRDLQLAYSGKVVSRQ